MEVWETARSASLLKPFASWTDGKVVFRADDERRGERESRYLCIYIPTHPFVHYNVHIVASLGSIATAVEVCTNAGIAVTAFFRQ